MYYSTVYTTYTIKCRTFSIYLHTRWQSWKVSIVLQSFRVVFGFIEMYFKYIALSSTTPISLPLQQTPTPIISMYPLSLQVMKSYINAMSTNLFAWMILSIIIILIIIIIICRDVVEEKGRSKGVYRLISCRLFVLNGLCVYKEN